MANGRVMSAEDLRQEIKTW
ncbi:antitoxin [Oleiphilus messinensis]|uniref:Antitoxin n=1 Tax=Oleiphilus messinensis TaxID=141451 RepID=A0A1Y0IA07_9GAMM|nr:antitoxin [Oleiphilus messinensis]